MKIRINAISEKEIDQYNMLRIGPDGEHLPINGIDWQDSNVFSGMPTGGGYILQARDVNGNIAEKVVPKEEPLEITAYGGYIEDGTIRVNCATNIPSQSYIEWGIPQEDGTIPRESMGWNHQFSTTHNRAIPAFYINAEHHYWLSARSQFNQKAYVNGRYVITPDRVKFDPIMHAEPGEVTEIPISIGLIKEYEAHKHIRTVEFGDPQKKLLEMELNPTISFDVNHELQKEVTNYITLSTSVDPN